MSCSSVIKEFLTVVEVMIPVIANMFCLLPGFNSISYMKFWMQTLSRMQSESMKRMKRLSFLLRVFGIDLVDELERSFLTVPLSSMGEPRHSDTSGSVCDVDTLWI